MFEIRFDLPFVEEAVFLELGRLTTAEARQITSSFHREREAAYELPDAQQREAAFGQVARRYFQRLGWPELFAARLQEFPQLSGRIELVVVRRVWNRKDEQVELYAGRPPPARPSDSHLAGGEVRLPLEASTTLFIGFQVSRCLDRGKLTAFLRHELAHVADMLDPAFAYDPHAAFGGKCEPENELIRERFRLLWDLRLHGRIERMGWQPVMEEGVLRREFDRAFRFLEAGQRERFFREMLGGGHPWKQQELLELARDEQQPLSQGVR